MEIYNTVIIQKKCKSCAVKDSISVNITPPKKLVLGLKFSKHDPVSVLIKTYLNSIKRSNLNISKVKENIIFIAFNEDLNEHTYNAMQQSIKLIPRLEYNIIVNSINVNDEGIVFLDVKVNNLTEIITAINPSMNTYDINITSKIHLGMLPENEIEAFKNIILEENIDTKQPLTANNFVVVFVGGNRNYELKLSDDYKGFYLKPTWLQLTT